MRMSQKMQQILAAVALNLICGWARTYTWGLPAASRTRRLAEIESDVWEQLHTPAPRSGASLESPSVVLARYLRGVPDDLRWRASLFQSARWLPAALFALCMGAGMQIGLLGPRILSGDRADASAPFFQDRLPETIAGHALIAIGLLLFGRLLVRWHGIAVANGSSRPLRVAFVVAGTAAAALTVLVFALTFAAAVRGSAGRDPETVAALYRLAGFTFHTLLSSALAAYLTICALLAGRTADLPAWSRTAGWTLALLLVLEALGGPSAFLLAQSLFLGWMVMASGKLSGRPAPAAG